MDINILVLLILSIIMHSLETSSFTQLTSPCPRFFKYEPSGKENNRWYGTITILSDIELYGVCVELFFDKPSIQIGNWFGMVNTTDNKKYVIENTTHHVVPNIPFNFRFYLKFNPKEKPSQLTGIRLNGRPICPEQDLQQPISTKSTIVNDSSTDGVVEEGFQATNGRLGQLKWKNGLSLLSTINFRAENETVAINNSSNSGYFRSNFIDNIDNQNLIDNYKSSALSLLPTNNLCGTIMSPSHPLLPFGQETRKGEFPWHAGLYQKKNLDLLYICGASLITANHLVTVAHCVTKTNSQSLVDLSSLVVVLGKYYFGKNRLNSTVKQKNIKNIIVHPNYNASTFSNDIAIIKLSSAVKFTNYVRPVCLWDDDLNLEDGNTIGTVAGWGVDKSGRVVQELSKTQMPIALQETCIKAFPKLNSTFISNETFCASFQIGTSVCNGDSGSGMVFPKSDSNPNNPRWQLRGLVSIEFPFQRYQKCDASLLVAFTNIVKYLSWITNSVN